MQPAASNVRHADMGEEAGHRVEEENGSCIAMAGEGSRLGARKVPATAQLREHCRQLDRASAWGGTLCVKQ